MSRLRLLVIATNTGYTVIARDRVLPVVVDLARECGSAVAFQPIPDGLGGSGDPGSLAIHVDARLSVNGAVKTLVYELMRADRHDGDPVVAYAEEELVVESPTRSAARWGSTRRVTRSRIWLRGLRWRRSRRSSRWRT